ncbi:MAG: hypothetical protein GXP17_03115 [Gammaproteobacteria bacterium]|nr:hypothetical protein [Gammaproteobacteria bacterium]
MSDATDNRLNRGPANGARAGRRCVNTMLGLVMVIGVLIASGCASVNFNHPQVLGDGASAEQLAQTAQVYFIRPRLLQSKGVADGAVRITFKGKLLLEMSEGSYALLHIKPSKGLVKLFNKTKFANEPGVIEVWRARKYKFIVGKTYFIYVRQLNEEFRGVFYEPEPVKLKRAQQLIEDAGPSGSAARRARIDKLTKVSVPPASATQGIRPVLPEDVYRQVK